MPFKKIASHLPQDVGLLPAAGHVAYPVGRYNALRSQGRILALRVVARARIVFYDSGCIAIRPSAELGLGLVDISIK